MTQVPVQDRKEEEAGLYFRDENGALTPAPPGTYTVDDDGNVEPSLNWQVALNRIPWERVPDIVTRWQGIGAAVNMTNLVGMYVLTAIVIGAATWLASRGIVEGQAIVGFLGAAIGYLLARGIGK